MKTILVVLFCQLASSIWLVPTPQVSISRQGDPIVLRNNADQKVAINAAEAKTGFLSERHNISAADAPILLAAVTIDAFATNQLMLSAPPSTSSLVTGGADIIGTRRAMSMNMLSGVGPATVAVAGGSLNFNVTNTTPDSRGQAVVSWDGDANANTLTPTGLGGVDLSVTGNNAIRINVLSATAGTELIFDVYSNGSNASRAGIILPAVASATDFYLNFNTDFIATLGSGANFASVGAIVMTVSGTEKSCAINLVEAAASAPNIASPIQTDAIIIDNGQSGTADPNDRIRYKINIQNTGTGPATNTQVNVVPDAVTTLVSNSFRSSPLAIPDAYTCTGNVGINVPAASGVKANDFDDNLPLTTLSCGSCVSANGGMVTLNNDGSFTYDPPAGFIGTDNFTYTITDVNPVGAPVPTTDNTTVTITVSNMVWFISNVGGGTGGTGTRLNMFKTLADYNASSGPAAGQVVYIQETGTDYPGGIGLRDNMYLIGTGHTGGITLADVLPFAVAPNSWTLPVINGTRPVITNATGDGVLLAQNNNLRGFNVGACSNFSINNGVSSVGDLVISEVSINNPSGGGGFDANGGSGAGMNVVFSSISTIGGPNGINLTNCQGTFTVNGGSILDPSGPCVLVQGGSVVFACSASLFDNTGFVVDVSDHDSGNVTLSGTITSTGSGIRVQNCNGGTKTFSGIAKILSTGVNTAVRLISNTGAQINFSGGGLAITTTSGTGFSATGGGTVNVTGTGNTINSPSGTALNMNITDIGSSGMTFQSISSGNNTAAADPTNGIVLSSTGTLGGLTVTGTGSAGSGGTIQNCTDVGVSLTNTTSVSLSRMNIQGSGKDGINSTTVTGFNLSNCTVTNNGNSTFDEGIEFTNLFGTCSMSNCTVTNNAHNNFKLDNSSGTLTSFNISGSTFEGHNNSTAFGNHGFLFEARGSALVTAVNVTTSIFRNNFSIGMQVITGDNATISSFIVNGCTFSDTGTGNSQEIGADFATAQTSNLTYQFLNNTLTGHNAQAFNTFTAAGAGTGGTLRGTIQGNTIGLQATMDSGSKIGNGMRININGGANARILVNNNTLHQIPTGRGIECIARNGTGGASFIVTNNTVTAPTGTAGAACGAGVLCPLAPIYVQTNCATVCNSACSVVSGNTAYDPTSVPGGAGSESSVQLQVTGASALTYEGNVALTALQNLTNANPGCVTKNVIGTVTVVAASTCPTP